MNHFAARLAFGPPVVFDGAMASELERRGFDLGQSLWSARALLEAPDLVRAVHLDHLRAGAEVVTTASYQASFEGFAEIGVGEERAARLMRRSVELARAAVERAPARPRRFVAASLGPYGAMLGGGREYDGRYGEVALEDIAVFHRRRIEAILPAAPDFFIFETLPRLDEALAVVDLLDEFETRAIMSFQVAAPDRLAGGDLLRRVIEHLNGSARVLAFGLNCCSPRLARAATGVAVEGCLKPIVVQPNSGESFSEGRWLAARPNDDFVAQARALLALGVRGLGACCRLGPGAVRALRELVGDPQSSS